MRFLTLGALLLALGAAGGDLRFAAADYAGAAREFEAALEGDPGSARLRYNLGTALLRAERYDEARDHLAAAANGAVQPALRANAYYNLGNAHLEPAFRAARPDAGVEARLRRAIAAYQHALLMGPADLDAKWNLELARRLLERRDSPEPGGSGGGSSGGGGEDSQAGGGQPSLQRADTDSPAPLSRTEAERVLGAARERELAVQREELRKDQPPSPHAH